MNKLDDLIKLHQRVRLMLLASLVFFLIGLFALVSRWDAAFFIILFACLFRLLGVWLVRRRYDAAWMEASVTAAAQKRIPDVRYTAKEEAPAELLQDLGFTPPVVLVPQNQKYHVLRGSLAGKAVTVAEAAFLRMKEGNGAAAGSPVSGTLLTLEDALPPEENWVILWHRPFDGILPLSAFYSAWTYVDTPEGMPRDWAVCFSSGGETDCLQKLGKVLGHACEDTGFALAARNGRLSLLLSGVFYAKKPDISQTPSESLLASGDIPGVAILEELCRQL